MTETGTIDKKGSDDLSMADLTTLADGYDAPTCTVRGAARSVRFHPEGYSLSQVSGVLEPGTELEWGTEHGDEALYVRSGELEVDGTRVEEGGMVIVESGIPAVVRAVVQTSVLHQAPTAADVPTDGLFGAPAEANRGVHAFGPSDAPQLGFGAVVGNHFADGTCPTCRISCFVVDGRQSPPYFAPSHVHSEDEIVHILDGELRIGRHKLTPGMSAAIPRGRRYGFRTKGGFRFLNYRRDVATITLAPGSPAIPETVEALRAMHVEMAGQGADVLA
jgi:quercetin dioxygenase-like cupin family protein